MARTRNARGNKKSGVISVDFTGVESSGNIAEGRTLLTVEGTPEVKTSESSGNDYINWKFKAKGGTIYHTTSLQPHALWNLRNTLEALGLEVPDSEMELDLSDVDGLTCGAEIEHEVYQGKKRPRIVDLFPESELEESEEEEEAPKSSKASSKKSEPEPEEELTWEELQDMSKEELLELAEENDLTLSIKAKKSLEGLRSHIASEFGIEEPEEEEPEEEEEEAPKSTSRRSRRSSSKELAKGSKVTFVDDGEDLSGVVKSINTKEKFAVVDVDGEEWEVELDDLTVA